MAVRDPKQRMDIPQIAGTAFDVRLQIVAGTVIAQMTFLPFRQFSEEKCPRRPKVIAKYLLCGVRNSTKSPQIKRDSIRPVTLRSAQPSSKHSAILRTLWLTSGFKSHNGVSSR
ncbi:MAG: hypothetical protein GPOALKHO_001977 [Sodalis sp.]|nr:MAG: hypothetical protein GPOALKHO_001977 [Sodalis sp.]